mmetsp:Transcript_21121/g.29596  ORF Transcript_21121/g.29596 Transcript_21121/m.29596 type:complete len:141 (+) Transcript_21121:85-507(+)|eukprot:CAMPEP_0184854916 /NCGR_PEP_ID=MMETSP0580-20130426/289_1 /TAXON_ID=1118495 /ORGANISM="Dactyliosolen fragilissimus" /LENGTH=140 /DNA_ID=CAMNT_0027349291 /DNA_START=53 /DNA_END=475 /DNA_ORIENTATION=+
MDPGKMITQDLKPDEIPEGFSAIDPTKGPAPAAGNKGQTSAAQEKEAQKRSILEQALTPEALARLGTIKLVKPEKVSGVESLLVSLAMSGKIGGRINEGKLIEMLEGIDAKQKKTKTAINIQRKKYAFDSDDDSDDDDLL